MLVKSEFNVKISSISYIVSLYVNNIKLISERRESI